MGKEPKKTAKEKREEAELKAKQLYKADLQFFKKIAKNSLYFFDPNKFKIGDIVYTDLHGVVRIDEDKYEIVSILDENGVYELKNVINGDFKLEYWGDLYTDPVNIQSENDIDVKLTFFSNRKEAWTVQQLLYHIQSGVLNINPDYQRDHVWSLENKVSLIDSIFNDIDVNEIVLAASYRNGEQYEMIDGKQRTTAAIEYFLNKFKYKGYYFSELEKKLKFKLQSYQFSVGIIDTSRVENPRKIVLEQFIKLNTARVVMDPVHLQKVIDMYNAL